MHYYNNTIVSVDFALAHYQSSILVLKKII